MYKLTRNFSIVGFSGVVLMTALLGYLYRQAELSNLIQGAQTQNKTLAQLFTNSTWEQFYIYLDDLKDMDTSALLQHAGVREFDKVMRDQSRKLNLHLISVVNSRGKIVYSTNPRKLGGDISSVKYFQQAKSGRLASSLQHSDIVTSLEELKLDRYIVTSYVPIETAVKDDVEAVLELQLDVTAKVLATNRRIAIGYFTIATLALIYAAIMLVIGNRAERAIKRLSIDVRQSEKFIEHQGYHDMLTGLPNRVLFRDKLEAAMQDCIRDELLVGLLFIDLDHFQKVNDALGYAKGDHVLLEVTERLQQSVRAQDTIARLGGDEFVIILQGITLMDEVEEIAKQVLKSINEPYHVAGHEMFLTPSIGIAVYPFDEDDVNSLLKKANSAMYKAKNAGRNTFRYFTENTRKQVASRFILENSLRRALERDEFELYFQPVVSLKTGKAVAVEALLRWHSREMGLTSPLRFIPLLEETGLIIPVGQWVLENACRQGKLWQEQDISDLKINVNMSAKQLLHKNLSKTVHDALDRTGLNAHLLDLEITESLLIEDFDTTIEIMDSLNELGISLSVDDFGTGYSSLSYLKRMPVDTLKIDQSFVHDIAYNIDDAAIVDAICALSKSLRFKVTAEGVENREQLELLAKAGVTAVQGYLFSRPLPASEMQVLLNRDNFLDSEESAA